MIHCPHCQKPLKFIEPDPNTTTTGDMYSCITVHQYPDRFSIFFNKLSQKLSVIFLGYRKNSFIYEITSGPESTTIVIAEEINTDHIKKLIIKDYAHLETGMYEWAWWDINSFHEQIRLVLTFS